MTNELAALSRELAAAVEGASPSVVAVHARPRFSSSGTFWRPGVIVTAEHSIRQEEEITVTLSDRSNAPATLAGRRGEQNYRLETRHFRAHREISRRLDSRQAARRHPDRSCDHRN
jgi:hypothetical protein